MKTEALENILEGLTVVDARKGKKDMALRREVKSLSDIAKDAIQRYSSGGKTVRDLVHSLVISASGIADISADSMGGDKGKMEKISSDLRKISTQLVNMYEPGK